MGSAAGERNGLQTCCLRIPGSGAGTALFVAHLSRDSGLPALLGVQRDSFI